MYAKRRDLAQSSEEKKAILYEIARVYETQSGDPAHAIETYQSVLEDDPADAVALAALDRLYRETERWDALILDRMLDDNTPEGVGVFFNGMLAAFAQVFVQEEDRISLSSDFLYTVYRQRQPSAKNLKAAIGVSFRLASANLAFTSDVMTRAGFIAPKAPPLTPTTSLDEFAAVAVRSTFKSYIDDLFYPYFKARRPGITLDDLIEITSLRSIEPYLRHSQKIGLMHNRDDIIMAPGEIDWLEQVFGQRAEIYPTGGHCGNMDHRDNVAHMIDFFSR